MEINVCKDYKTLGERAALLFAAQVTEKPTSVFGFATGSSPISTYDYLAKLYEEGAVDFSKAVTYNLDEYYGMAPTEEQSYRKFMNDNLFSRINIKLENTHVLDGLTKDAEKECADYEKAIAAAGGIDMQLLGIGHDGHIGFNEPCDEFPKDTHLVDLVPMTLKANARFFGGDVNNVPKQALSMGIGSIMRARKVVLVANGADKANAIAGMVNGPVTPKLPASILQFHPNVTVFLDEGAASKL